MNNRVSRCSVNIITQAGETIECRLKLIANATTWLLQEIERLEQENEKLRIENQQLQMDRAKIPSREQSKTFRGISIE